MRAGLAVLVLMLALASTASAALIDFRTDGKGLGFGSVTISGHFSFDSDTGRAASAVFHVSGAGERHDGIYDSILAGYPSMRSLTVLKAGASPGPVRVPALDLFFASGLDGGGTVATAFVGLADFEHSRSVRALFLQPGLFHEGSAGTVSQREFSSVDASLPLPGSLPILLIGLAGIALVRQGRRFPPV